MNPYLINTISLIEKLLKNILGINNNLLIWFRQIGEVFTLAIVIKSLFGMLKVFAETAENKILVIQIFENLIQGPIKIVKSL